MCGDSPQLTHRDCDGVSGVGLSLWGNLNNQALL